jgi:hypothetical protein
VQTEKCNLIAEKAIEIIEEVLSLSLNPEQRDLVNKLEKNQDLFHESIYRIEGKGNELIVALESIYYLFFYDFETKTERNSIDETLLVKLQDSLSTIADSVETQKSEVVCHFMKYLESLSH